MLDIFYIEQHALCRPAYYLRVHNHRRYAEVSRIRRQKEASRGVGRGAGIKGLDGMQVRAALQLGYV